MKSKRPKALHEICGKPMLQFVLDACYDAGCTRILLVVGHGKDEVVAHFEVDKRIEWVEQAEQLGTGHAARVCEPHLRQEHGDVFILTGDGPLVETRGGAHDIELILDRLARLTAHDVPHEALDVARRVRAGGSLVVLTGARGQISRAGTLRRDFSGAIRVGPEG